MGDLLRRNSLLAVLVAAAIMLALALAVEIGLVRHGPEGGGARRTAAADAKLLPALGVEAPEQAYPEVGARPLFTPTRRPAPEPAVASAQPAMAKGQFVLLGVTIAGDTRIAIVREKASGRLHRIARGGEVNGLKVGAIETESVTLTAGGDQEVLPLTVQRPGGAPATPGGPPQAASIGASVMQGPFGAGAGATANGAPATPPPAFTPPPGFTPPPQAAFPAQPPQPIPGQVAGVPPAMPANAAPPGADPGTAMTPEQILAARRARRAQQTQ